jgi:DNA (cytosine-5)-methyltransferase 1
VTTPTPLRSTTTPEHQFDGHHGPHRGQSVDGGTILELFGGPGGWSEALRLLGESDVAVELDPWACATRAAAGHRTIRADVTQVRVPDKIRGLIASPPCPTFSAAGSGEGRDEMPALSEAVGRWAEHGWSDPWALCEWSDPRTPLVLEPLRFLAADPGWIASEQVPAVLPLWKRIAEVLTDKGWSAWAGVLNSADFGVPQTRKRAILMAHRTQQVHPPEPTHAEHPEPTLFGDELLPWVSMADALGWDGPYVCRAGAQANATVRTMDQPAPTVLGSWDNGDTKFWPYTSPAITVAGDPRITARCHHENGSQGADDKTPEQVMAGDYAGTEPIKLTIRDALILQSFDPDYPVAGPKTAQFLQVGNAIPVQLAEAILRRLLPTMKGTK